MCQKAIFVGQLAGSSSDPLVVWLIDSSGERFNVEWPPGFYARFEPEVRLIAPDRSVVAQAGDTVRLVGGLSSVTGAVGACEVNGRGGLAVALTPDDGAP